MADSENEIRLNSGVKVMAQSKNLHVARIAKKDEFYTQLSDIENELRHYKDHFKDKVVYCNCDDPRVSNFFKFFSKQFEFYGLKKLITTCYQNQQLDLFSKHHSEKAIYLEYHGDQDEIDVKPLQGDGDFRSAECIEFLKEADIVVTNPPFSLFREYVAQLMKYDKKFLIIGNINAITYKDIFPLIKENKVWLGPSISNGALEFRIPDDYPLTAASHRVDEYGSGYVRVKGVRWFTNLPHKKRNDEMILYKRYTPEEYPHYENYDAIEVSKTKDIPQNWGIQMGVPITFLDKYNPDQFEIIGLNRPLIKGLTDKVSGFWLNGRAIYARILIRNRHI